MSVSKSAQGVGVVLHGEVQKYQKGARDLDIENEGKVRRSRHSNWIGHISGIS